MVSLGLKGCRRLSIIAAMKSSKMFVGSSSVIFGSYSLFHIGIIGTYICVRRSGLTLVGENFCPLKRKCLKTFFDDASHVRRRGLYINLSSTYHQPIKRVKKGVKRMRNRTDFRAKHETEVEAQRSLIQGRTPHDRT